jgi:hypothetical protein
MRGSALAQVRVCALAKYDNTGHAPTVRHRAMQCQPSVRAISGFGLIVQEMDSLTAWNSPLSQLVTLKLIPGHQK